MIPGQEPIRVLRIIARLNVGGPALHVAHLSRELDRRGYETTLVAGRVGDGEGSMEYVADELGVEPLYVDELQREISVQSDAIAVRRLMELIRRLRPDVLHRQRAGARGARQARARELARQRAAAARAAARPAVGRPAAARARRERRER